MFHKYKKGFISLFLALAVMLSCCVPVFATITTTETDTYFKTRYENESVTPYNLWIGKSGDFIYHSNTSSNYYGYFFKFATVSQVTRNSDKSIRTITLNIIDANYYRITANSSSFDLFEYKNLYSNSIVINSSSYSSTYFYELNIDKIMVSTSLDVVNGETFTYLDHAGNEKTITFDGNGGIVGGFEVETPDDNPFGDLTEQDYPEFNLPEYSGKDISEYVDFEEIIDSIKGLDVAGAVQGLLGALKGGFQYVTNSVINIVSHLALTLVSLFDWLKETLPILFGNMVVKLNPLFESLYLGLQMIETAIKENPIGEFVFDEEGLFGKLDSLSEITQNIFTEPLKQALLIIPNIKDSIDLFFTTIKAFFDNTLSDILDLYNTLIDFRDKAVSSFNDVVSYIQNLPFEIAIQLQNLFIPDESYISDLKDSFSSLLIIDTFNTFITQIKNIILSNFSRVPPVFEFEYMNAECSIDFTFFRDYILIYTDPIIIFFSYFYGLKWFLFSSLNLFSTITTDQVHQSDYLKTQDYRDFIRSTYSRRR